MTAVKVWVCLVAMSIPVGVANAGTDAPSGSTDQGGLEEIVVTAQKRVENLMDVPVSVGVLNGDTLASLNVQSLSDLSNFVSGLNVMNSGAPGNIFIAIRGVSSGYNGTGMPPTVATLVDDVPVGPSNSGASAVALDMAPYDLERIEVLRGPQGTLYGANALGGIVKYVLSKPSLTAVEANGRAALEYVDNSGGMSGDVLGSLSIPIVSNVLAIRFSGFYEHDPGYIDNVGTGIDDANTLTRAGGRATLLWRPAKDLTLEVTYLGESSNTGDATGVTVYPQTTRPVHGWLIRSTEVPEHFNTRLQLAYFNLNWDINFATLTNSSSWSWRNEIAQWDQGQCCQPPNDPTGFSVFAGYFSTSRYTEEFRLTSRADQRVTWFLGTFWDKEDSHADFNWNTYTPDKVIRPGGLLWKVVAPVLYKEWAVFGTADYHFTDRWTVTGGVRYAENTDETCQITNEGPFGNGSHPCTGRPVQGKATWLGTLSFIPKESTMLYARFATGYRPGGGCETCGNAQLGLPDFFYPDNTVNYEVGVKGRWFDNRLQLDTSFYYIDWKNMQYAASTPAGDGYISNAGGATIYGVDCSALYQATRNLKVSATLGYNNAYLTTDVPNSGGVAGAQLPQAPHWVGSLIVDYNQPLSGNKAVLLGAHYAYRDTTFNGFPSSTLFYAPAMPMGPQNLFGLYTGLRIERTTLQFYAKNLFNNHSYNGLLYLADPERPMLNPVQPRMIGLSVDYRFK